MLFGSTIVVTVEVSTHISNALSWSAPFLPSSWSSLWLLCIRLCSHNGMSWKHGTLHRMAVVNCWHIWLVYWLVVSYFQSIGLLKGVPQYVFCIEHNLAFLILESSLFRNFRNRINTAVALHWILDLKKLMLLFINRIFQAKEGTLLLTCLQPNFIQGCQQLPHAHLVLHYLYIPG